MLLLLLLLRWRRWGPSNLPTSHQAIPKMCVSFPNIAFAHLPLAFSAHVLVARQRCLLLYLLFAYAFCDALVACEGLGEAMGGLFRRALAVKGAIAGSEGRVRRVL